MITEGALRWHSHEPDVIIPQLDRIASLATLRHVWIGLLPYDAPLPGIPEHNFQLYMDRNDDQDPVVRIELIHARATVSDADDVAVYIQWFERFRQAAVDGDQAQELLRRIAQDIRRTR